ncbi:MAG: hypothetical protein HUJ63_01200, partial [Enterococcus sp.]|nr:hypothetical protein [Enterococcus sp.]
GRPLPGTLECPLGRETGLAQVEWKDGWPYIKQTDGSLGNTPPDYVEVKGSIALLPGEKDKNLVGKRADEYCRVTKYEFKDREFLADFKGLRVPLGPLEGKKAKRFSLDANPGFLRIYGGESPISNFEQGLLARRQRDFVFEAETKVYFEPDYFQQLAGLTYRYDEDTQYNLCITYDEELGKVLQFQEFMLGTYREGQKTGLPKDAPVWLKVSANYDKAYSCFHH